MISFSTVLAIIFGAGCLWLAFEVDCLRHKVKHLIDEYINADLKPVATQCPYCDKKYNLWVRGKSDGS